MDYSLKPATLLRVRDRDVELDDVIGELRAEGLSKVESIHAIWTHRGSTLKDAKLAVHLSPAWDDRRKQDEQFHDELISQLEDL